MCRDPPIVKINQGMISGMFMKMYRTQRIVAYMGINYAMPPIDGLRFQPPVIVLPPWEGVRNGSISQPSCLQRSENPLPKHTQVLNKLLNKVMDVDNMMSDIANGDFSEDCLYLNVFVPDGKFPLLFQSQYFDQNVSGKKSLKILKSMNFAKKLFIRLFRNIFTQKKTTSMSVSL
jgi:carboxylesterase type B